MKERDTTQIRVKKSTKERLNSYGRKNDTYDYVIGRLMDIFEHYEKEGLYADITPISKVDSKLT